jgi:hypothetical protein
MSIISNTSDLRRALCLSERSSSRHRSRPWTGRKSRPRILRSRTAELPGQARRAVMTDAALRCLMDDSRAARASLSERWLLLGSWARLQAGGWENSPHLSHFIARAEPGPYSLGGQTPHTLRCFRPGKRALHASERRQDRFAPASHLRSPVDLHLRPGYATALRSGGIAALAQGSDLQPGLVESAECALCLLPREGARRRTGRARARFARASSPRRDRITKIAWPATSSSSIISIITSGHRGSRVRASA